MSYNQNIISFLKTQLQARFGERLKKIILFGSRARGDADEDSDYDVLILLENCTRADSEILVDIAVEGLLEFEAVLSLFPFTADSLERYPFEPMFMNIRKEGIEL